MTYYRKKGSDKFTDAFKCSDPCNIDITNGSVTKNSDGTYTVINKYGEEIAKPCDYIVMTEYGPHAVRGIIFNYLFEAVNID